MLDKFWSNIVKFISLDVLNDLDWKLIIKFF